VAQAESTTSTEHNKASILLMICRGNPDVNVTAVPTSLWFACGMRCAARGIP